MINNYLIEFREDPNGIEEYKIIILKDFYYDYINSILKIKKDNFQIGVNKNDKILFFRDKVNPSTELVLNIIEKSTFFNYRREISYSVSSMNLDKLNSEDCNLESNKLLNLSINKLNKESRLKNKCCINRCIIS